MKHKYRLVEYTDKDGDTIYRIEINPFNFIGWIPIPFAWTLNYRRAEKMLERYRSGNNNKKVINS